MSEAVYMLVIGKGFTEAWYQLSEGEKESLWSRVAEIDRRAGAKWIIACDSRWADEGTSNWVVIEYPNMEAYQEKVKETQGLDWWRYWSAKTILGTSMPIPEGGVGVVQMEE